MKKMYLLLAGLFCTMLANAQLPVIPVSVDKYTIIDTVRYIVTYELTVINNPEAPKKQTKDIVMLEIGHHSLKSYSKLLYQADSTASVLAKKRCKSNTDVSRISSACSCLQELS